jgi:hypothetical protein
MKVIIHVRRILENSEREIEAAVRQARNQLRAFAANLAVSLAHQSMRIDEETDHNLIAAFVSELQRGKEPSLMVSEAHVGKLLRFNGTDR